MGSPYSRVSSPVKHCSKGGKYTRSVILATFEQQVSEAVLGGFQAWVAVPMMTVIEVFLIPSFHKSCGSGRAWVQLSQPPLEHFLGELPSAWRDPAYQRPPKL